MSSESEVRILTIESLRFPGEGSSAQGKSGPKPRAESRRRWTIGRYSDTTLVCLTEAMTQKWKVIEEEEKLDPKGIVKK